MGTPWTGITGNEYQDRRVRGLADWNPKSREQLLRDVQAELQEEEEYWPVTARHVLYRLMMHRGYSKAQGTSVETVINRGRRSGEIPWEAISDGRSDYHLPPTSFDSPEEFWRNIRVRASMYRRRRQTPQQVRIELWVEAAGLVDQIGRVADDYDVPVYTSSGFNTTSARYEVATRIIRRATTGLETRILLVGDRDPDGYANIDSTADDVLAMVEDLDGDRDDDVAFDILALTEEQIREHNLPTEPPKVRRPQNERGNFSGPIAQVEALDAADLATILEDGIRAHLDEDALASLLEDEERERAQVLKDIRRLERRRKP